MNSDHRIRTLVFVTILHGFTHVYQVALIPLYLPIRDSLKLSGEGQATFLLTLMYAAYFLPSYFVGVMADRFSRKKLLASGLILNGLGFIGLALAPSYPLALACAVAAGQHLSSCRHRVDCAALSWQDRARSRLCGHWSEPRLFLWPDVRGLACRCNRQLARAGDGTWHHRSDRGSPVCVACC
jgi:hypothetical protein